MHTPATSQNSPQIAWTKTGGFDIWTGDDAWIINRIAAQAFRLSRHDGKTFLPETAATYTNLAAAKAAADNDVAARHAAGQLAGAA